MKNSKLSTLSLPGVLQRSLQIFEESIRSPITKKAYKRRLDQFLGFSKIQDYDSLVKTDSRTLQILVEDFVMDLKHRHRLGALRASSFNMYVAPLALFCSQNDIVLNFKKITRMFPRREKQTGDKPYTDEEIAKMLKVSNVRWKSIIHFLASTGVRPGALFDLQIKHIKEMGEGCTAVKIYAEDPEEYFVFLRPEATSALHDYLKKREFDGEKVTPDSALFRNHYREAMAFYKIKKMNPSTFYSSFVKILEKAGIRKRNHDSRYRHEARIIYGFRKRYNTKLKLNHKVNPNIVEKMMGHQNGLDGAYLKPTIDECFIEFRKAISALTIDISERQKIVIKELEQGKPDTAQKLMERGWVRQQPNTLESHARLNQVVSVVSIQYVPPPSPGGPKTQLTLLNAGLKPITSLKAILEYNNNEYLFNFKDVTKSNPLISNYFTSDTELLVGTGFATGVRYPLTVVGTVNNETFSYTLNVHIPYTNLK